MVFFIVRHCSSLCSLPCCTNQLATTSSAAEEVVRDQAHSAHIIFGLAVWKSRQPCFRLAAMPGANNSRDAVQERTHVWTIDPVAVRVLRTTASLRLRIRSQWSRRVPESTAVKHKWRLQGWARVVTP